MHLKSTVHFSIIGKIRLSRSLCSTSYVYDPKTPYNILIAYIPAVKTTQLQIVHALKCASNARFQFHDRISICASDVV